MTKNELYRFTRRLYSELRNNDNCIILKKIRGNICGIYDYSTEEITLDYRRELIPTILHEYLHKWYPDLCETSILAMERSIINTLSIKQIKNIIKAFGASL